MEIEDKIKQTAKLIKKSKKILFFTGAGISTGSGIPDYRGPKGIWKIREPVYYHEFLSSDEKKIEYWEYKADSYYYFKNAKPNEGHLAIVEFEKKGILEGVVTQNIDGLHIKAGNSPKKVVELHGTNSKAVCLNCNNEMDIEKPINEFKQTKRPPRCSCGGYLKPDVVMFDQPLNPVVLQKAFSMAHSCDLCISVGSTLLVQPAASIPYEAYLRKIPYIIINLGKTQHDNIATIKIEADSSQILNKLTDF